MIINKYIDNYFLILFCLIPLTIIIGSTVSLINILLIDISFLILIIKNRNFEIFKDKTIFYFFLLYFYLIFNSLISIDFFEGFFRNFGFLRIIVLFMAFNFFFLHNFFWKKVLKFWSLVILIVLIDVFIESFFGKNILGYTGKNYGFGERIVSFFEDEPIVGSYLTGFFLIIIGFLIKEIKSKNFLFMYLIMFFFILAIVLTGERTNTIKAVIGLGLFLLLVDVINIKKKIFLTSATIVLVLFYIFNPFTGENFLKHRYYHDIINSLNKNNIYLIKYKYGLEIFKENKLFGVGNKNYRIEACKIENIKKYNNLCSAHPHQIYLEFLSEHGIIGTLIILFVLFKLIFSKILTTHNSSNYIKLGSLIYISLVFLPLLPSGAFFSNYSLTIFAINLSIFYALDKKLNIYNNKS